MATTFLIAGDTIKLNNAFFPGKYRVSLNGDQVFEGKIEQGKAVTFSAEGRGYSLTRQGLIYAIDVFENGALVESQTFDQRGKSGVTQAQAKANGAVQACGMLGMGVGLGIMFTLNATTKGAVPGGVIGGAIIGAICGGVGGGVGYAIGKLLFLRQK